MVWYWLVVFYILSFNLCFPVSYGNTVGSRLLIVGKELKKETLPLKMGYCEYQLLGLNPHTWYEVKISYPTSIPASFSIELESGSNVGVNRNRKLLNTEKLIFKTGNLSGNQSNLYALVTVEPEGVVAIPGVSERKDIIFNIVCDELLLGIPHKAWWVGIMVLLCLGLAFTIPRFLPSYLLLKDESSELRDHAAFKES